MVQPSQLRNRFAIIVYSVSRKFFQVLQVHFWGLVEKGDMKMEQKCDSINESVYVDSSVWTLELRAVAKALNIRKHMKYYTLTSGFSGRTQQC